MGCGMHGAPGGARKISGLQGNGLPRPLRGLAMTGLGGAVGLDMEGIAVVAPKTFPLWGKREGHGLGKYSGKDGNG